MTADFINFMTDHDKVFCMAGFFWRRFVIAFIYFNRLIRRVIETNRANRGFFEIFSNQS